MITLYCSCGWNPNRLTPLSLAPSFSLQCSLNFKGKYYLFSLLHSMTSAFLTNEINAILKVAFISKQVWGVHRALHVVAVLVTLVRQEEQSLCFAVKIETITKKIQMIFFFAASWVQVVVTPCMIINESYFSRLLEKLYWFQSSKCWWMSIWIHKEEFICLITECNKLGLHAILILRETWSSAFTFSKLCSQRASFIV